MRRPRCRALILVPIALYGAVCLEGCGTTTTVTQTAPASIPTAAGAATPQSSRLRRCDPNISANTNTSCPFAENVFKAYAESYQAAGGTQPSSVGASSPVTGRTYSMFCATSNSVVTCTGGQNALVIFPLHAVEVYGPVPPTTGTSPAPPPSTGGEDVGSYSHSSDAQFCSTHQCIGAFQTESGYIVQCVDGTYSHAGGIQGACSHHGGEQ
jgi:hypothetical protein